MMKSLFLIAMVSLMMTTLAAQPVPSPQTQNPLLMQWTTPFGMPPFDKIKEEHFLPAYDQAIAERRKEIDAIVTNTEPPTFANTIEVMNYSGALLEKVASVFGNLNSAETNSKLQEIAKQTAPRLAALQDDILLNEKLFLRVKTLWEKRTTLQLAPDQLRLLEETYKNFIRGGANLSENQKSKLRAVNQDLSLLGLNFAENLLKETNAFRLVIEQQSDLAGLPEGVVAAGAQAAKSVRMEGKWVYTLQAPSIWPFLTYSQNRELREQLLTAYLKRCDHGNEQDNNALLVKIASLRAQRAALLGYKSHADFVLEERMAKTPEGAYKLLHQLWKPALAVAKKEAADLQAMITKEGGTFSLAPWDWRYYAEKVKMERYALDETEVSQYFSLDNVREGAFYVANRLYGITFKERTDLPKYHSEVKTFEVLDSDGSHLGVFLVDYHPRPGKRGGAWSSRFRGQQFRDGVDIRPIVVNVGNFTRPTATTPALLRQEEVETLFHELGHGLHSLLSRIRYRGLAGVPQDFVELPSQIMEHWAFQKEVLKKYARHWKSGEPIPDNLIEKMQNAEKFNQGFITVEYLAASLLDMDWHSITKAPEGNAAAFEQASMSKIGLIKEIPPRYRSSYFQHIFAGGYSAGYYSYIWSEVLDTDAFSAFKEKGIFDQATATSFRKNILEQGGMEEAMTMYKKFRGREPSVEPLLEKRGLK